MKKFKVIQAILVLFSALAITSCGEDITLNPLPPGGFSEADLRMAVGTDLFIAETVTANVAGGAITFNATNELGEQFVMVLNETALTLSNMEPTPPHLFPYNNVSMTYRTAPTGGEEYVNVNPETGNTTGSIVITAVDLPNRTISGHFAFVGYNTADSDDAIAFYSGSFTNVLYTGAALPQPVMVTPQVPDEQFMKAKINGGEMINYSLLSAQPASGNLVLSGGTTEPNTNLSITVPETIAPGTYPFAGAPAPGAAYGTYTNGTSFVSQSGTINITTNSDGVIQGTFSFTGSNGTENVEVTEGSFMFDVEAD